tara:strand:- start:18186 stop:19223 length:1038 start_codon:yes stop_codon:yes gene_type:complete
MVIPIDETTRSDSYVEPNQIEYSNNFTQSFGSNIVAKELYKLHGQRYLDYRAKWEHASKGNLLEFPINLTFDLINSCNLKCPQCLRAEEHFDEYGEFLRKKALLTPEFVQKTMNECSMFSLPSVNIGGGGEPTTHPKFLELVKIIMNSTVMELRIITNGLRLNEKISQGLIDMQVPILSVSIDANSEETFHLTRGRGDKYELVISNIMQFLEIRKKNNSVFPLLRVSFVSQPDNKHELKDFKKRWEKLADLVDIQAYCSWNIEDATNDFFCPDPWLRMLFYAEGRVSPCCGFTGLEYEVGRIEENKTVYDLWHSKEMNEMREMINTKTYKDPCLRCMGTAKMHDD